MTSVTFNTHATVKNLITAGHTERQAEAIVDAMLDREVDLATKTDLAILKRDLIIWLGGIVITAITIATGVMVTLQKDIIALMMKLG